MARSGGDPLADKRRTQGMPTFAEAAATVVEQKQSGWRSPRQAADWFQTLERYVFPRIGSQPVSEVASADVLAILTPIWHVKMRTARTVRQRISAVLEWSIAMEHRSDNPCARVGPVLGKQRKVVRHMRALPHRDVAAAVGTVRASRARQPVKLAFEFVVVTAARSGEVRLATWEEMDVNPLVFPNRLGNPVKGTFLSELLRNLDIAAVPHGFRSSFRDWAAEETDHPREVVEAALAHAVRNPVEAAYARSDLFERRRRLMDDWAEYLYGLHGGADSLLGRNARGSPAGLLERHDPEGDGHHRRAFVEEGIDGEPGLDAQARRDPPTDEHLAHRSSNAPLGPNLRRIRPGAGIPNEMVVRACRHSCSQVQVQCRVQGAAVP